MSGKVFKVRDLSAPVPRSSKGSRSRSDGFKGRSIKPGSMRVHRSPNVLVATVGTVCLLVGLIIGASLVAIPVAATAHAISSAWDNAGFMSMKTQEVPETERRQKTQSSDVITSLD